MTKEKRMKIFFVASHPQLAIGYSKIASFIGNYIASYEEIEFVHYALETPFDGIAGRYMNPDIRIIPVESMGFDDNRRTRYKRETRRRLFLSRCNYYV